LFICFLEMGSTSIFFNSIITKMAPQGDGDETMLSRFSNVFNRYLVYTFIVLILCYAVTIVLFNYNDYVISSTPGEIMGIDLGSIYGIWLLVIIMIASAFMFWYLIPREKTKTSEE
jgi:ribose/xylose/arabinose/galactoside ABC-type transport system permease subunit